MTIPHVPVIGLADCKVPERKADIVLEIGAACASSGFL